MFHSVYFILLLHGVAYVWLSEVLVGAQVVFPSIHCIYDSQQLIFLTLQLFCRYFSMATAFSSYSSDDLGVITWPSNRAVGITNATHVTQHQSATIHKKSL